MKKFDDHELQRLLRQISIPSGLQEQLQEISQQDALTVSSEVARNSGLGGRRNRRVAWRAAMLAMVAALTAIGLYVLWPNDLRPDPPSNSVAGIANREQPIPELAPAPSKDPQRLLAELSASAAQIDQVILQMKIQQMELRLAKLNHKQRYRSSGIQQREATSLVLALSDESAIRLGANRSSVQMHLNYVVEQFPGTRGAKLARKILSTEL